MDGFAKSVGTVLGVGTVAALGMLVWEFTIARPTHRRHNPPVQRKRRGASVRPRSRRTRR